MSNKIATQIKSQPRFSALPDGQTLVFELPLPTSTNKLFANVAGRGRVKTKAYRAWIKEAGQMLLIQRPRYVAGAVALTITLKDGSKTDPDNCLKGAIDLLVRHQVIDDDKGKNIRGLTVGWGAVDGAKIEIRRAA